MEIKCAVVFDKKFGNALNKLASLSLPVKSSLKIAKAMVEIQHESKVILSVRDKIFKDFDSNQDKTLLDKKVNDLLNSTFSISLNEKIELDDVDGNIEPSDLLILEPILKF